MILTKIREYLGVGLALVAAMAVGVAVINHLRYNNLQANMKVIEGNNTVLSNAQKQNIDTINSLVSQRLIDDQILQKLDDHYEQIKNQGREVRDGFLELKSNDAEFKDLLSSRHPLELNKLLNSRSGGNGEGSSKVDAANATSQDLPVQ